MLRRLSKSSVNKSNFDIDESRACIQDVCEWRSVYRGLCRAVDEGLT